MISGLFVGLALGFILQRGQFCLSRHLRNIIFQRNLTALSPLLLAIAVQSVGFYLLERAGLIRLPTAAMPISATLLGGLLFGVGMGTANRCVTGHLYRTGEGSTLAWLTLLVFALTTAATQTGVLKFWIAEMLQSETTLVTFQQSLGVSSLYLIVPLCAFAAFAFFRTHKKRSEKRPHFLNVGSADGPEGVNNQACLDCEYFFPKNLFREKWSPHFTALCLGLLSILAWALSSRTGREFGLSFSVPLGNALQYVVLGQQRYLNWGTYLVFGVVIGSLIAAWLSGNLIWKALTPAEFGKGVAGGVLMGVGAALAGGCTMANAVVGTAYFSWQAWLATLMMMFGLWCFSVLRNKFVGCV